MNALSLSRCGLRVCLAALALSGCAAQTPNVPTAVGGGQTEHSTLPPSLSTSRSGSKTNNAEHARYKVIDLGSLGGPQEYFNAHYLGSAYGTARVLTDSAVAAGWADTRERDPYMKYCFIFDCYVTHAFRWTHGDFDDLGALPSGESSSALFISPNGLITGNSQNGKLDPLLAGLPETHAVLWRQRTITDLGTLGGYESFGNAVNSHGEVVGGATNSTPDQCSTFYLFLYGSTAGTQTRAFLWRNGKMRDLGTLGGPDAIASVINERGDVAGSAYLNSPPNCLSGLPTFHPFLWRHGKMRDLGTFGGTQTAGVTGLNDRGEVAGGVTGPGDQTEVAFLWNGTKLIKLSSPGQAEWINNRGQVVGEGAPNVCGGSPVPGDHAFLWNDGKYTDLGVLRGMDRSDAVWINDRNQIVGFSGTCNGSPVAILWENGSIADLNTLIRQDGTLRLVFANNINDRGEIAGIGTLPNGDVRAYVLVPRGDSYFDRIPEWVQDIAPPGSASLQRPTPSELVTMRALFAHRHRDSSGLLRHMLIE
jgi:probable HAF family extracellular repeat protein